MHEENQKPGSFFGRFIWGLAIIFIGLLLLGQNAGVLPSVDVGNFFATFWPVFIILAGLSILARSGWVMGLIATLIAIAMFALMAGWFLGLPIFGNSTSSSQIPVVLPCAYWNWR